MAGAMRSLFHMTMFSINAVTVLKMLTVRIPELEKQSSKFNVGHSKYLTFWNLILQAVFFFICFLNDWFGTNAVNPKKPPLIRRLKDNLHAMFAFPTAMFVGSIFWSLYAVDRELVFPKVFDPYFPNWLNHLMHTSIMVSILTETIIAPRKYPKRSKGIICNTLFMITYLTWMLIIYFKSDVWVYPVFHVLNLPMRILFFATMAIYTNILYLIGETLDNCFWGNEYTKHQKSHAKSK